MRDLIKPCLNLHFVAIVVLSLPALIVSGQILGSLQPDAMYYGPLTMTYGPLSLNLPFLVVLAVFLVAAAAFSTLLARQTRKLKTIIWAVLAPSIIVAAGISIMIAIFMPQKFYAGHTYCEDQLIAQPLRCEGTDKGFMQGRVSAVARFGVQAADIDKIISTYPDFNLWQVDCADLAGGFGSRCFTGSFLRATGDTNFINVYLQSDKILVLETENIVIGETKADGPVFMPGHEPKLADFLDLARFADDMK